MNIANVRSWLILTNTYSTFKYHVSYTDRKISVRINLLFYLFFHRRPNQHLCFFPVGKKYVK